MSDNQSGENENTAYCMDLVRQFEKDRYLATLFAPAEKRPDVFALYAFGVEIARIRENVSEPGLGEIRMQWWSEAIEALFDGNVGDHPVLRALAETIVSTPLSKESFLNLIEARRFDLYDDAMPTMRDLEGYAGETSSVLIQMAALVLGGEAASRAADAAGHAGVAYAITGLLRSVPMHRARGQMYVPEELLLTNELTAAHFRDARWSDAMGLVFRQMRQAARNHLAKAREFDPDVAQEVGPAFLPVSLIELYLNRMEKAGFNPFKHDARVSQLRRQFRLLTASWQVRY